MMGRFKKAKEIIRQRNTDLVNVGTKSHLESKKSYEEYYVSNWEDHRGRTVFNQAEHEYRRDLEQLRKYHVEDRFFECSVVHLVGGGWVVMAHDVQMFLPRSQMSYNRLIEVDSQLSVKIHTWDVENSVIVVTMGGEEGVLQNITIGQKVRPRYCEEEGRLKIGNFNVVVFGNIKDQLYVRSVSVHKNLIYLTNKFEIKEEGLGEIVKMYQWGCLVDSEDGVFVCLNKHMSWTGIRPEVGWKGRYKIIRRGSRKIYVSLKIGDNPLKSVVDRFAVKKNDEWFFGGHKISINTKSAFENNTLEFNDRVMVKLEEEEVVLDCLTKVGILKGMFESSEWFTGKINGFEGRFGGTIKPHRFDYSVMKVVYDIKETKDFIFGDRMPQ